MTKITAADVNKLRQQTGAGMMDCKNALTEAEGDFDKAIEVLRKKGQKVASKRADREANEGYVVAKVNENKDFAMILMLNCETDFVAKNDNFVAFANLIADYAIQHQVKDLSTLVAAEIDGLTLDTRIAEQTGKIGEKIELSRYEIVNADFVSAYNHPGNRIASIVGLNKKDSPNIAEVAKEITMQIAAMNPVALDEKYVPQEVIEKEIEIGKEQAIQEGKNPELAEKIAKGKLNKFFKENTLVNQEYIGDSKKTVAQYLSEQDKDLQIIDFKRLGLGQ